MLTSESIGWTAGILDGEGHLTVYRRGKTTSFQMKVTVVNTDLSMLMKLQEIWGGTINDREKLKNHHKDCYSWTICSNQAALMLEAVGPHMRTKKELAGLVLAYQAWANKHDGRARGANKEHLLFVRGEYAQACSEMNS